jgi:hypothetical protein
LLCLPGVYLERLKDFVMLAEFDFGACYTGFFPEAGIRTA